MKTVNELLCEIKALRRRRDNTLADCKEAAQALTGGIAKTLQAGTAPPREDRARLDQLCGHVAQLEVAADQLEKATNKLLGAEVPPALDHELDGLLRGIHDIVFQASESGTPPN